MTDRSAPYSNSLKEFYYSAPPDRVALDTLEFRHPAFMAEDGVTPVAVRVVNANEDEDFTATLEADAPMDAGETVTFIAARFDITLPESNSPGLPSAQVAIDNVGQVILEQIERAVSSPHTVEITYRQYLADEPDEPGVVIDGMSIGRITVSPLRITATAGFEDDLNTPFGRKKYTPEEYPGLVR